MRPARRILIVDDDPYTRDLVGTALRGQGYEVVVAPRYAQGLEAARAQRPHLLLLDVVLPDGSGVELARLLRHELPEADLPSMILMSAFSRGRLADQRRMKEEAKAVAFVTKPLALPALIELVEQTLSDPAASPRGAQAAGAAPVGAVTDKAPGPDPAMGGPVRAIPPPPPEGSPVRSSPARLPGPPAGAEGAGAAAPGAATFSDPGRSLFAALAHAWRRGWSGTLAVSRPSAAKTIVIERGQVVWATTSLVEERLGRVVLRMGFLPRDEYEPSLREAAESGRRLGEELVARGYLTAWQLDDALAQHVEGIVLGALGWPEGSYQVAPTPGPGSSKDRITLSPIPRLVVRAFAEVVSADRLDARLAAVGDQPVARRSEVPQAAIALLAPTLEESALLDAIAAPTPLARALAAHPRGPDAAAPYLCALLALGIVCPAGARGGEEEPLAPVARGGLVTAPAQTARPTGRRPAAATSPPPASRRSEEQAAHDAARRLLEAEAAFETGRGAVERGEVAAAAEAFARATSLCPEEGEYRAWSAWVRALSARAAFDRTLDEVTAEMERAAGLTPSSEGVYELIRNVVRLRREGPGEGEPPPAR